VIDSPQEFPQGHGIMKRMLGLAQPLKVLQSASDLEEIILRRGRTDLNLRWLILLKVNFQNCGLPLYIY